ncbi:MAG: hypothetical protein ACLT8A_11060 [Subdoligranulum sp.]
MLILPGCPQSAVDELVAEHEPKSSAEAEACTQAGGLFTFIGH